MVAFAALYLFYFLLNADYSFRNSSGSFATLAAIRRGAIGSSVWFGLEAVSDVLSLTASLILSRQHNGSH
jgi:hypothetical protein